MNITTHDISIAGINVAIPQTIRPVESDPIFSSPEEARKVIAFTGVEFRPTLDPNHCVSDLCTHAATELLDELNWNPDSIGGLIFISQDPDYSLPATSCVIQHRLGLSKECACLDLGLGCSGFIYGLSVASQMLQASESSRFLILCGDNSTRHLAPKDKGTHPLFGDAGAAIAIEKKVNSSIMQFTLGSDGSGAKNIMVKGGGKRFPIFEDTPELTDLELLEKFNLSRLSLKGPEIFSFTIEHVPPMIRNIMGYAGIDDIDEIDQIVFHQANAFILNHLRKKVGIPAEKCPIAMKEFGNTSSASIPLTIAATFGKECVYSSAKVLLAGFGVGWSWGACVTDLKLDIAPRVLKLPKDFKPLSVDL